MAGAIWRRLAAEGKTPPHKKSPEWKDLVARIEAERGRAICGACSRQTGWPCEQPALPNGRCGRHGGRSLPPGPTHPRYSNGRYSKVLGGKPISELYEKARADPHLLALNEEIALLIAKQQQTLELLPEGSSWEDAKQVYDAIMKNWEDFDEKKVDIGLKRLGEIMQGAANERGVWAEYMERVEQIRKLVDTERKYREGMKLYLTMDQANAIMGVWLDVIRQVVPQDMIQEIYLKFRSARYRLQEPPSIGMGRDVGK
jgi:hypothetical protein